MKFFTTLLYNALYPEAFEASLLVLSVDNWEFLSATPAGEGLVQYMFQRDFKENEKETVMQLIAIRAKNSVAK